MKRLANGWMQIPAFTIENPEDETSERTMLAQLQPELWDSKEGKKILQLMGPISYYIDDLVARAANIDSNLLCIDMGGRNFGVDTSVYVDWSAIQASIREMTSLAKVVVHARDPR